MITTMIKVHIPLFHQLMYTLTEEFLAAARRIILRHFVLLSMTENDYTFQCIFQWLKDVKIARFTMICTLRFCKLYEQGSFMVEKKGLHNLACRTFLVDENWHVSIASMTAYRMVQNNNTKSPGKSLLFRLYSVCKEIFI